MSLDLIFWIVCFVMGLGLVAFTFYQMLCLLDLEADFLNIYEAASQINSVVLPEFILQGVLCAIFLLTWHWFMFLVAAPVALYHVMLYVNGKHLVDVTEIFRNLNQYKKLRYYKLGAYMFLLIVVLTRLTLSAFHYVRNGDDLVHLF
ncbi:hypothetical protein SLEP1_g42994 [Rubroshorea leprosula]|uniref:Protein cornichon homolog 1 n=1 Tax=Rubroshorea leprosula TaxID=152421 RepID=A0AAV5LBL6_9ROSI|nr:hypothetical protein SLEP1_g42994 [Rubroshorea leprosula]